MLYPTWWTRLLDIALNALMVILLVATAGYLVSVVAKALGG